MESTKKNSVLSENELENVTGGGWIDYQPKEVWKTQADAEGRTVFVLLNRAKEVVCPNCGAHQSIFAREKVNINNGPDEYRDCKCYACAKKIGNVNTEGFIVS